MNHRFLISVAATALIAGVGFANAQGTGGSTQSPSATTQQQPSSSPSSRDSSQTGAPAEAPKSAQSKDTDSGKNQRAQDNNAQGQKSKNMSSDNQKSPPTKDMKAEDRNNTNNTNRAEDRNNNNNNMNRAEDRNRAGATTTTGQAGAGAKLSTEQRSKITTVIRSQHVQPVTNVNFSISVGTRVPKTVHFHPLPTEIVTIYPEWRGFEFFLVNNQIVVVNPRTLEIVDVIDA